MPDVTRSQWFQAYQQQTHINANNKSTNFYISVIAIAITITIAFIIAVAIALAVTIIIAIDVFAIAVAVAAAIVFAVIVVVTVAIAATIAIAVGVLTVGVAAFPSLSSSLLLPPLLPLRRHHCYCRCCLQIADIMSEETDLTTGDKSTSGKKIWVKKIAREVSEGLGKHIYSLNMSHLMWLTTMIDKISNQHLLHRQKPRMLTIYYQMNVTWLTWKYIQQLFPSWQQCSP
jgi:hypothetical protein